MYLENVGIEPRIYATASISFYHVVSTVPYDNECAESFPGAL
jgi:hypothetical protein